jgi:putative nucleotidyltransferase with HDIG domain
MLRVRKEDLRLGMYVRSLEGSWFNHPFWKSKFLLTEPEDLRALQSSDVEAVWVDPQQSHAAAIAHLSAPPASVPAPVIAEGPGPEAEAGPAAPKPRRPARPNEFHAAQTVLADCKAAVRGLFAQIQNGDAAAALEEAAPVVGGIADSVARNPDALLTLARIRSLDEYSYAHSVAVSALMINLARELQLPPEYVRHAGTAGLFMDVGKAYLPAALLGKRADYGPDDWAEMRRHPRLGADAVTASGEMSKIVADVCLHHHERHDGSGYPYGLRGDNISLFARMAAICDTYDALVSARHHRAAFGPSEAVVEMYKYKGQFDESLLNSFIRSVGVYPAGSLVRLESRRLGCVASQRRDQLTRPLVRIFYSVAERAHLPVEELDLADVPEPDRIVAREEPARWGLANWDEFALTILQGQKVKRAA